MVGETGGWRDLMPEHEPSIDDKVYHCTCPDGEERTLSLMHLLSQFKQKDFLADGVSRISDLHLKTGTPPYYRIDNEMVPWSQREEDKLTDEVVEKLIAGPLTPEERARLDEVHDLDASFSIPGLSFRMNVFHDRRGLAAAIRVLPTSIPAIETIGFPDEAVWKHIVSLRQGMVILTGITGSGKSTTIASLVQRINETRRCHIITLEDPIEYLFENKRSVISQRQVGRDVPSFASGLRSILREDPDIIVVGEMRDRETMANALTAAETGHLVFSTLHTRDAKGAITRIADTFPEDRYDEIAAQISLTLTWVIAQKLIPRSDGRGRVVAMEVLRNTSNVGALIRTMKLPQIYSAIQTGMNEHMCTLERSLVDLVQRGVVTPQEAEHWANLPDVFRSSLGG
jgi:twitching motility protein PilT